MTPVKQYMICGVPFQLLLIICFLTQAAMNIGRTKLPIIPTTIGLIGIFVFSYSMMRIYFFGSKLITDGLFKYTRHPMYTGFVLIGIEVWWPQNVGPVYFITLCGFIVGLLIAGYFQEKEVLAKYGQEAIDYYKKTPRLFFLYPFMN